MDNLTEKYRILFKGSFIVNSDYLQPQTGITIPGFDVNHADFSTIEELQEFIKINNLEYIEPENEINTNIE
jgi:hypothetical protein